MPELCLYPMHAGQEAVYTHPVRKKWLAAGRRWRKTTLAVAQVLDACLDGETVLWGAPTVDQCRIGWNDLRDVCGGWADFKESIREVRFPTGGRAIFRSLDNPDNARGHTYQGAILDEAAFCDPDAYHKVIGPVLAEQSGWLMAISSPDGFNWFYQEWARAERGDDPDAFAWQIPVRGYRINDGQLIPQPHPLENPDYPWDELVAYFHSVSEATFRQEAGAEFVAQEGRVFPDFSRDRHVRPVVVEPYLGVELGIDFGFRTFAFAACQVDKRDAVRWFAEAEWKNITTGSAIERLRQYDWADRVEFIACDPAGDAAQLQTGIGDVEVLRSAFPNARVTFSTTPQHRNPEWRAGRIRDRLWSASGQARSVVHPDCKGLIRMFELSQYPRITPGRGEKAEPIKDGVNDHLRDAVGYHEVCRFHAPRTTISARRPI